MTEYLPDYSVWAADILLTQHQWEGYPTVYESSHNDPALEGIYYILDLSQTA